MTFQSPLRLAGLALLPALLSQHAAAQAAAPILGRSFALVQNAGQWNPTALYQRRAPAGVAWFVRDGWVLDLGARRQDAVDPAPLAGEGGFGVGPLRPGDRSGVVLDLRFEQPAPQLRVEARDKLPGYRNYLRGQDPRGWRSRVSTYSTLRYAAVYPGIDAVVRPGQGLFAYDLHVAPGADLGAVRIRCAGMDRLTIAADGDLVLSTPVGELRQSAPVAWQVQPDGSRSKVVARFVDRGEGRFGFEVDSRNPELPLVIDPDLTWASYYGGSSGDYLSGISRATGTGSSAKALFSGGTFSSDFPTKNGLYRAQPGSMDGVILHIDPSQSPVNQVIWATYIGGSGNEWCYHTRRNVLGQFTAVGLTGSSQFPVTNTAYDKTLGGRLDGFILTLNPAGTALVYSTYWGGSGDDWVNDFREDVAFGISFAGYTDSTDLPTTSNAFQGSRAGGLDAYVARLRTNTTNQLSYSTYLGGSADEGQTYDPNNIFVFDMRTMAVDVDAKGRVVVSGRTLSSNFPTSAGAFQTRNAGMTDAWVSIVDPLQSGSAQLVYSTLLGGDQFEGGMSCAFADQGRICVAGYTRTHSTTVPFPTTPGAIQRNGTTAGTNDAFVTWFDPARSGAAQLSYSTRLGVDGGPDAAGGVFIDDCGVANLAGYASRGFPTTAGAFQPLPQGDRDAFFARVHPGGQGRQDLIYATVYGGQRNFNNFTIGFACAPDGAGGAFLSGWTQVNTIVVTNGSTHAGGWDGFAAHLWGLNLGVTHVGNSTPVACAGGLLLGAQGAPTRGNGSFRLAAWNTQPNAVGFLGLGVPLTSQIPLCGAQLVIQPVIVLGVRASAGGEWSVPTPIPATTPGGTKVSVQTIWASNRCCLTASNALAIDVK